MNRLFTIGHSTHAIEVFTGLLKQHGVTAVADVRSLPYSRYSPQFSRESLKLSLGQEGIAYVFLGKELGARSENPACYSRGRIRFDRLAEEPLFLKGLERVRKGLEAHQMALMCAEKDPLNCHRGIMISRRLSEAGVQAEHILSDGRVESHAAAVDRMLQLIKMPDTDMFRSRAEILAEAYRVQGERIAYENDAMRQKEMHGCAPGL
jgi:uncharacterized protein (DUF488 family)